MFGLLGPWIKSLRQSAMNPRYRVAYLVSHPIQYQAPLLRRVAAHPAIDLTVFFLSDFSARSYQDPGFSAYVHWDVDLLSGYQWDTLPAIGDRSVVSAIKPLSHGIAPRLRKGRFDALWVHGYAHHANLRAIAAARRLGMTVLLRGESHMATGRGDRFHRGLKERLMPQLFKRIDGFLTIGSRNRAYYEHYGVASERLFCMPYVVDNAFFQDRVRDAHKERNAYRESLGLSSDRPVILFASKFLRRKGARDLLEAYARLSPDGQREPSPYLLLAGDGDEGPALRARAHELGWQSIRVLGFRNQTELPALFDLCDVFVLPSLDEPWGLIVNEVMNAAKPIIVSDQVGCAPDLVADGQNGYVVPAGDVTVLSQRLDAVTANPALALRMGAASLDRVSEWGIAQAVTGLYTALETLTDVRRPIGPDR